MFINLFIYIGADTGLWGVCARQRQGEKSEKRKKRKGIEGERAKPRSPTHAIGALIGEEEKEKRKKK